MILFAREEEATHGRHGFWGTAYGKLHEQRICSKNDVLSLTRE